MSLRVPRLLALAAAPTFAAMALWSVVAPSPARMLCSAASGSPLDAMTAMYLLMAVFHLQPWLQVGKLQAGPD